MLMSCWCHIYVIPCHVDAMWMSYLCHVMLMSCWCHIYVMPWHVDVMWMSYLCHVDVMLMSCLCDVMFMWCHVDVMSCHVDVMSCHVMLMSCHVDVMSCWCPQVDGDRDEDEIFYDLVKCLDFSMYGVQLESVSTDHVVYFSYTYFGHTFTLGRRQVDFFG